MSQESQLHNLLKSIRVEDLSQGDKLELLNFFVCSKNPLIFNQIAFLFADSDYNEAVPFIIKKINDKSYRTCNGSLVYALSELDTLKYFSSIVKILCTMDYEARLSAYEIIEEDRKKVSGSLIKKSIDILKKYRLAEEEANHFKGENSTLHFIEQTIKLLQEPK